MNASDRRAFKRFDLTCPITVTDSKGRKLLRTQTLNISDGGALLAVQENSFEVGELLKAQFKLPRSTPNTYMFEDVSASGTVVRRQEATPQDPPALAIAFIEPLRLQLE